LDRLDRFPLMDRYARASVRGRVIRLISRNLSNLSKSRNSPPPETARSSAILATETQCCDDIAAGFRSLHSRERR
jgi:hypothetical protein